MVGGTGRNNIARTDSNGILDAFNPNADDAVNAIAVQSDGKIIVGGDSHNINGTGRNRVIRLLSGNGSSDGDFRQAPGATSPRTGQMAASKR